MRGAVLSLQEPERRQILQPCPESVQQLSIPASYAAHTSSCDLQSLSKPDLCRTNLHIIALLNESEDERVPSNSRRKTVSYDVDLSEIKSEKRRNLPVNRNSFYTISSSVDDQSELLNTVGVTIVESESQLSDLVDQGSRRTRFAFRVFRCDEEDDATLNSTQSSPVSENLSPIIGDCCLTTTKIGSFESNINQLTVDSEEIMHDDEGDKLTVCSLKSLNLVDMTLKMPQPSIISQDFLTDKMLGHECLIKLKNTTDSETVGLLDANLTLVSNNPQHSTNACIDSKFALTTEDDSKVKQSSGNIFLATLSSSADDLSDQETPTTTKIAKNVEPSTNSFRSASSAKSIVKYIIAVSTPESFESNLLEDGSTRSSEFSTSSKREIEPAVEETSSIKIKNTFKIDSTVQQSSQVKGITVTDTNYFESNSDDLTGAVLDLRFMKPIVPLSNSPCDDKCNRKIGFFDLTSDGINNELHLFNEDEKFSRGSKIDAVSADKCKLFSKCTQVDFTGDVTNGCLVCLQQEKKLGRTGRTADSSSPQVDKILSDYDTSFASVHQEMKSSSNTSFIIVQDINKSMATLTDKYELNQSYSDFSSCNILTTDMLSDNDINYANVHVDQSPVSLDACSVHECHPLEPKVKTIQESEFTTCSFITVSKPPPVFSNGKGKQIKKKISNQNNKGNRICYHY